jgi:outer membrane protein
VRHERYFCRLPLSLIVVPLVLPLVAAMPAQAFAQPAADLTLEVFMKRVLERNESLQGKLLEVEINRRKARGEYGAFEPEVFGSVSREANKRENTAEQATSQLSDQFNERNNIYQGGLETLVPTGAKVRLGYTLRDLNNSLQGKTLLQGLGGVRGGTNGEYQTFFGFTLTQPLLKNAWYPANLAGIRLAALASDVAFQEYRRQLMVVVSTAEASYWNLYMAQEQVRFFEESVATAQKILHDNRERLQAGKGSELEVLQAEAALALRQSKLSDAEQKRYEASNRVISLYAESVTGTNRLVRAVDRPQISGTNAVFFDAWRNAYESNPDYLMQRQKALQESVRLAYAKNQRLPELDVKGSYGLNGLGETPGASWDDVAIGGFPSWSIGLEMRFPLAGGIKGRNELAAARLREKEALVSLQEIQTQIANALDTALHKINSARDSVQSYENVVSFNTNLLATALARLEVGLVESRKVLDIESDLFEARNSVVDALVQYQRALLEFDLVQGVILKKRDLELTQKELEAQTTQLLQHGRLTDRQYASVIREVQLEYEKKSTPLRTTDTPAQASARRALGEKMAEWPLTNRPPALLQTNLPPAGFKPDPYEKLRDATRRKIEELKP